MHYAILIATTVVLLTSLWFTRNAVTRWILRHPYFRKQIGAKITKTIDELRPGLITDRFKHVTSQNPIPILPDTPLDRGEIEKRIDSVKAYSIESYKISGAVYADEDRWRELVGSVYAKTAWLNPTHPSVWPNLVQLEAEVYAMCSNLFHLDNENESANDNQNGLAVLTPGGTMSNIQALYAYREKCYSEQGITYPNVVAPNTAHSSFKKACQILDIEYRMADTDPVTGKADTLHMRRLIDSNTICLIGSAPSFPYGIIDPIESISNLAIEYGVGFHLDCCLGGFQVPFVQLQETCDFRTEGITSISADPHKFGQTPKGISILMFRSFDLKKYLTFVDIGWTGGMYVMPDFLGSRSGSNIAILWAMINSIGRISYTKSAQNLIAFRAELCEMIRKRYGGLSSNEIYVFGEPELSTFGIKSEKNNIHYIAKKMHEYGWEFNSLPDGLHFCLTEVHYLHKDEFVESFFESLDRALEYVKTHPDEDPGVTAQIYCTAQSMPKYLSDCLDETFTEIGREYIRVQNMVRPTSQI